MHGEDGWLFAYMDSHNLTFSLVLAVATSGLVWACLCHGAAASDALLWLLHDLSPPQLSFPEDELQGNTEGGGGGSAARSQQQNAGSLLFTPLRLRGLTLRNRVIKAAAFEAGCDKSGAPLSSLIEHHREIAAGGAALTTVAYAAVSVDGRSFASQLLLTPAGVAREGLTELVQAVHSEGGAVAVQLTHAGSFAKPQLGDSDGRPIAPSTIFNPAAFNWAREMSATDMRRVASDFAAAAELAVACNVDAIEVHLGHGYLLSQFLSPYSNRRTDEYGGQIENRMRFPLEVLRGVRAAVGSHIPILVKFNLGDGFVGGQTLSDAIELAKTMYEQRVVDLLIPSGGWITRNGLFMLRGAVPLHEMVLAQPVATLRWSLRLFGRMYVPMLPWKPHFFEEAASELLNNLPAGANVCLLGGVSSQSGMEAALARGFQAVSVARMLLREPGIVHRMHHGLNHSTLSGDVRVGSAVDVVSKCSHCNLCIVESAMAERPVRCVERDIEDLAQR